MRACTRSFGVPRVFVCVALFSLALLGGADNLEAQVPTDSAHRAQSEALVTRRDALIAAGFTLATAVVFPNDRHLAIEFRREGVQQNAALRSTASVFRAVGQPGVLAGGVAAWGIGRLAHRPVLAAAGLHVTEAIVVTGALTLGAKYAFGRARPATTNDRDPYDFHWWKGTGQGYTSMPSGHTSAAFAAASALAGDWQRFAPGSARFVVPALYTGASLVGFSRMYHDRHWGSDVLAGAALGTLAGRVVGRWGRNHANNPVQRWLAPVALHATAGAGGELGVAFAREW